MSFKLRADHDERKLTRSSNIAENRRIYESDAKEDVSARLLA